MVDIVDKTTRSKMMSSIRGKNTKPEILIRSALHKRGFRYRLHDKKLPGKPDIVLPKHKAIILVHGCFWHRHNCHLFKWPSSRPDFWMKKINLNAQRDLRYMDEYWKAGWRVLVVWECALKGAGKLDTTKLIDLISNWTLSKQKEMTISGETS